MGDIVNLDDVIQKEMERNNVTKPGEMVLNGENTHRLLVRGKRTKYVPKEREKEKKKKKIGNSQWMRNYRKGIIIGLLVSSLFLLLFKIFQKLKSKKQNRG